MDNKLQMNIWVEKHKGILLFFMLNKYQLWNNGRKCKK